MGALHRKRSLPLGARLFAALAGLLGAGTEAQAEERPSYWDIGTSRPFAALTFDAGFIYARPQLAIGYGKPFRSWVGLEVFPGVTSGAITQYAGLRLARPEIDWRAGARYVVASSRNFVPGRASYGRDDVDMGHGEPSRYLSLESELTGSVRVPLGSIFGVLTGLAIVGVPRDRRVFEDALHQVIEPPFVWRGRLGYALELGADRAIRAGLFGEVIHIPGRGAVVGRAGPVAGLRINDHLDLLASAAFVLASPDRLGLMGGEIAQLGIRYRWATGEPAPFVPWR